MTTGFGFFFFPLSLSLCCLYLDFFLFLNLPGLLLPLTAVQRRQQSQHRPQGPAHKPGGLWSNHPNQVWGRSSRLLTLRPGFQVCFSCWSFLAAHLNEWFWKSEAHLPWGAPQHFRRGVKWRNSQEKMERNVWNCFAHSKKIKEVQQWQRW